MAKTYVFEVKHPEGVVPVRETIELEGPFNAERAKQALKEKFPNSKGFSFQGVQATVLEQAAADTSFQEPGYGPWK